MTLSQMNLASLKRTIEFVELSWLHYLARVSDEAIFDWILTREIASFFLAKWRGEQTSTTTDFTTY